MLTLPQSRQTERPAADDTLLCLKIAGRLLLLLRLYKENRHRQCDEEEEEQPLQ
jgi:hypothetical protein